MAWTDEISVDDFEGELDLPFNKSDLDYFETIVNEVTEERLRWILGDVYYATFEADLLDVDISKLWLGGVYSITEGSFKFAGLKKMCLYFIYTKLVQRGKATLRNKQDIAESNAILADGMRFTNQMSTMWKKGVVIHAEAWFILKDVATVEYKHLETWEQ